MDSERVIRARKSFETEQAARKKRQHSVGSKLGRLVDRAIPPLQIENDHGDPALSVYRGSVEGVRAILRIGNNQMAGRDLRDGVVPSDILKE
jgi:hypothetical protein